jgi:hypothetical protein
MRLVEAINHGWFNFVHRHNLVYNTCWEDPRIDRAALGLGPRHGRGRLSHGRFSEHRGAIPYLPLAKAAYYLFLGRKQAP